MPLCLVAVSHNVVGCDIAALKFKKDFGQKNVVFLKKDT